MTHEQLGGKKAPKKATLPREERLLVGRDDAAAMLSISPRAVDYLVANRRLATRRIGSRVLIPTAELRRFSQSDHPERLAG